MRKEPTRTTLNPVVCSQHRKVRTRVSEVGPSAECVEHGATLQRMCGKRPLELSNGHIAASNRIPVNFSSLTFPDCFQAV